VLRKLPLTELGGATTLPTRTGDHFAPRREAKQAPEVEGQWASGRWAKEREPPRVQRSEQHRRHDAVIPGARAECLGAVDTLGALLLAHGPLATGLDSGPCFAPCGGRSGLALGKVVGSAQLP